MAPVIHPIFKFITPDDQIFIDQIAAMYLAEWDIPMQVTIDRLTNLPLNAIPFHIVLLINDKPAATAGVHHDVGLLKVEPRFSHLGPWVSLVYTLPEFRKQGLGALMCTYLEDHARSLGVEILYLYTATAEKLYQRLNWIPDERFIYKGLDTVLMWKKL